LGASRNVRMESRRSDCESTNMDGNIDAKMEVRIDVWMDIKMDAII
jgi:hypothetical protein